jgi:hypothetical protein
MSKVENAPEYLRDYLAGQALAGMLSHATRYRPRPGASSNWHEAIAEEAYQIADAMLDARAAQAPATSNAPATGEAQS